MATMSDAITAVDETIKCVDQAIRILGNAPIRGRFVVAQSGIVTIMKSLLARLRLLREEMERDS